MEQISPQQNQIEQNNQVSDPKSNPYIKFIIIAVIIAVIAIISLVIWKLNPNLLTPSQNQINNSQQSMENPNNKSTNAKHYMPSAGEWKPMTAISRGKNISFDIVNFDPPFHFGQVTAQDLNTDSPIQTSAMYYHLLAEGKIEEASRVTTDPAKTVTTMTAYQTRLGEDTFQTYMFTYFTDAVSVIAIVRTKDAYLLLVKDSRLSYTAVQVYQELGGRFNLISNTSKISDATGLVISYFTDQNH